MPSELQMEDNLSLCPYCMYHVSPVEKECQVTDKPEVNTVTR